VLLSEQRVKMIFTSTTWVLSIAKAARNAGMMGPIIAESRADINTPTNRTVIIARRVSVSGTATEAMRPPPYKCAAYATHRNH
jgi:hypothetical protein